MAITSRFPISVLRGLAGAIFLLFVFLAAVSWNRDQVFIPQVNGEGLVVLADGDCHARMQRAQMVLENPGIIIDAHDFENHPIGTHPHTTAPLDYLIAALAQLTPSLDIAGAWISPLLGLLAILFLVFWSRRLQLQPRWPTLLLFCLSPALTHAFALGRPDHQSLLVLLTTLALTSQFAFLRSQKKRWAWMSGTAWGLALSVSWFEPIILLIGQEVARTIVLGRAAWPATWRYALLFTAGLGLSAWALEGFRGPWPDAAVLELFPRWAPLLGELQSTGLVAMFRWTGWLLLAAPFLLAWDYFRNRDPLALILLLLLTMVIALTGWQARWSPWLAMTFALALPWMLRPLGKPWIIWPVFLLSLWPVAAEWEARLLPSEYEQERRAENIVEAVLVRQVADFLQSQPRGGVLAPWWISPALARQSEQPLVGGSSHQSLPGSADTARFFLAKDDQTAVQILRHRRVLYVVSDAPERVIPTSATLLGLPSPPRPLITRLDRGPDRPAFLEPVFANPFFRVYKFEDE